MLLVEFGPTGSTRNSMAILPVTERALQPGGNGSFWDMMSFIFTIVIIVFVCWYMYEEGTEIVGKRLSYFKDPWNVLDWINMILILINFGMRILVWSEASSRGIGQAALGNKDQFSNLRGLAVQAESIRLFGALNACLVWLKTAKYLRKVPVVKDLIRKIWTSLELFVPFLFLFCLVFIGFVISYSVGFGDKIQSLSTFSSTVVYLARSFLRDVKLMAAYDITPMFGAMMILLFYVSLVLVGVTIVNAIFCDVIYRGKFAKKKKEKPFQFRENDEPEQIEIHEDEPVEEFVREIKSNVESLAEKVLPKRVLKYIYFRKRRRQEEDGDQYTNAMLEDADKGFDDDSPEYEDEYQSENSYDSEEVESEGPLSRRDVLRAIEHMSGRVLSEVSIVGIEIRSELHDICERVAQMQMAVEELTWRTDKVKEEQDVYVSR